MNSWELPSSWAWAKLDSFAETTSGGTPKRDTPDYYCGSIPWLKSGELNDSTVNSIEEFITDKGLCNSSAKLFPQGTLCIALYGATVGKLGILGAAASTNQAVCGIFLPKRINTQYLFRFLQFRRSDLVSAGQGGAQPNISQAIIRDLEIPIPPEAEQLRIVQFLEGMLSELESSVAALQRAKANLKRYRASVLKAACEGRLVPTEAELARKEGRTYETGEQLLARILKERRSKWEADQLAKMIAAGKPLNSEDWKEKYKEPEPPDTSNLPELPEGWMWASVEQISSAVQYGSSAKCAEVGEVPVLRMGNITVEGQIDSNYLKYLPSNHPEFPELLLRTGDLLFNRTNSSELVGKSAVYKGDPTPCSFASYLIRVVILKGCLPDYLAACLNSSYGRSWVKTVVNQQVGQANVNGTKLQAFVFPLPPTCEQERIAQIIEEAFSISSAAEQGVIDNLARAARLRQSILKRAFEGMLVPQDPNDEPASVLLERIRTQREQTRGGSLSSSKRRRIGAHA